MAGFGDNTTSFQRHAVLPQGGMIMEAGCFTAADVTDLRIPTQMVQVISCVISSATTENIGCISIPCVSQGVIVAKVNLTPVADVVNYVACGY